jgi:hypothetical protein
MLHDADIRDSERKSTWIIYKAGAKSFGIVLGRTLRVSAGEVL